jgi:GST-like protein
VIELFTADTPNGKKISIMLEEIGYKYKLTKIDISKDEQFKPEFIKLSPFSKIPVITDMITMKVFSSLEPSLCI